MLYMLMAFCPGPTQAPQITSQTIYSKLSTSPCITSASAVSRVPHPTALLVFRSGTRGRPNCSCCDIPNTTAHLVWMCSPNPPPEAFHNIEQWESALRSCQLEDQEAMISRVKVAVAAHGLLELATGKKRKGSLVHWLLPQISSTPGSRALLASPRPAAPPRTYACC